MNLSINPDTERAARNMQKFLFDRSFDAGYAEPAAAPEPPKPIYTEDDAAALCAQSREEGFAAGQKAALDAEIARQKELLDQFGQRLAHLGDVSQSVWEGQTAQMQLIASLILRKLMPRYVERAGADEVMAIVARVLADMTQAPRLVIRVADSVFDQMNNDIEALAAQYAFSGKVIVLGDAALSPTDCRIEWADGGIERDIARIWQDIDTVLETGDVTLPAAETPPGAPPLMETGDPT